MSTYAAQAFSIFLVILTTLACGSSSGGPIYHGIDKTVWTVDPILYEAYHDELDAVTEMWCASTKGTYCSTFSKDESGSPDVVIADEQDEFNADHHAWYDPNTGLLSVKLDLPKACMRHIIGHELAHSIPVLFDANTCPEATPAPEYGEDRIVEPWHCRGTLMGGANINEPDSCLDDVDDQTLSAFWASI